MIESLRARWLIILTVIGVSLITVAPNFLDIGDKWWFSKNKLSYGLDIQGGLHLVLGVDVEGVVAEKTQRMVRNLPTELKDQDVKHGEILINPENSNEIFIGFNGPAEEASIKKFVEDFYGATLQVLNTVENKIVIRYFDSKIQEFKKQVINQAIEVIRNRIDEFGVNEPSISAQGDNRIIVQLPGLKDSARAKDLINRTAKLTFNPISTEVNPTEIETWVADAEKAGNYALGKDGLRYSEYLKRLREDLKDKLPKDTMLVFEKAPSATNLEAGKIPFLVQTNNTLSGDLLEDALVRADEFGKPEVIFRFGVEGRRIFAQISGDNVGKQVAIVLDGVIQSSPVIDEKIDSPTARIRLNSGRNIQETQNEAQFIATTLRAGALPAALEQLEERTVGPTLGQDAIDKGKFAGILGVMLVFLFMIFYYRSLGIVADITLLLNLLLMLAVLTSLGSAITLPGVAGLVLTIGMAVDANVIIYERIKEELRKGTGLKTAVNDGFKNAFSAIFDSNITTVATCVVLIYFGTGPVRGFGVTLISGIATSMFTAIFVTKAIIDLLVVKFNYKNLVKV